MFDYQLGSRPSTRSLVLIGTNADVDIAASETVWPTGGTYVFPTAVVPVEVVSSSVNDTSAGTGARTVTITGLDGAGAFQTETVTLNGTTAVATTLSWLRINTAQVATVGSGLTNAGTISVRHITDTPVYCTIAPGENASGMAVYSVPAGSRVLVCSLLGTTTAATSFTLDVLAGVALYTRIAHGRFGQASAPVTFRAPPIVVGPADVIVRATAIADNTPVTAQLELLETTV